MLDFLHSNMGLFFCVCVFLFDFFFEWGKKWNGNKAIDLQIGYNPEFADLNRCKKD